MRSFPLEPREACPGEWHPPFYLRRVVDDFAGIADHVLTKIEPPYTSGLLLRRREVRSGAPDAVLSSTISVFFSGTVRPAASTMVTMNHLSKSPNQHRHSARVIGLEHAPHGPSEATATISTNLIDVCTVSTKTAWKDVGGGMSELLLSCARPTSCSRWCCSGRPPGTKPLSIRSAAMLPPQPGSFPSYFV